MKTLFSLALALILLPGLCEGQLQRAGHRTLGSPGLSRAGSVALLPFADSFKVATVNPRWTSSGTWTQAGDSSIVVANSGFETAGAGGADPFGSWSESVSGSSLITQSTNSFYGGYSCQMYVDAGGNGASVSQTALTANIPFRSRMWVKGLTAGNTFKIGAAAVATYTVPADTLWHLWDTSWVAANNSLVIGRVNMSNGTVRLDSITVARDGYTYCTPTLGAELSSDSTVVGDWYSITASQTNYFFTGSAAGNTFRATARKLLDANNKVKRITLASTITRINAGTSDLVAQISCMRTAGTSHGLVISYVDTANFVLAYGDGLGNAKLDKCVAGVWTNVITGAITYVDRNLLKVTKGGNEYSLYYNGTQVGSTSIISDAGLVSNTQCGIFSTISTDKFDNYYVATFPNITLGYSGSSLSARTSPGYYPDLVDVWFRARYPTYNTYKSQTGIGSCGTWNALARFYSDISPAKPRVIIHDTAWQGTGVIDRASMEAFIRRCAQLGSTPIIVFSATVTDKDVDSTINNYTNKAANDSIRSLCSYYGVTVVDWPQRIKDLKDAGHHINEYFSDIVHHTALGDTVMSGMIDTVLLAGWSTLPDTSNGYRLTSASDFARAPQFKRGTQYDSVSGSWTTSGDTLKSSSAGAIIYFSGTFSSFGTDAASVSSDFAFSVDGGAYQVWSIIGQPQNGYYIGTYGAHTVALKVNSGACAINKFYMI